jgi:hypothetical protein
VAKESRQTRMDFVILFLKKIIVYEVYGKIPGYFLKICGP